MGRSFHLVRGLEPPVREIEDRVMFVPRSGELVVEKNEARLLLVCDGRASLSSADRASVVVGPGDILIATGCCRQAYRSIETARQTRLHFFRIVLETARPEVDGEVNQQRAGNRGEAETDFTAFVRRHFSRPCHLPGGQTPEMQELLMAIRADADGETSGFRHRVNARVRLLVALIGQLLGVESLAVALPPHRRKVSQQVKEFLLSHAGEALTLDDVARHARLSAEHLARVFRRETGGTIFDFLRTVRVERAKTLLNSAPLSINELARAVGYSSTTLFCRNFKRATGVTPTGYRHYGGGGQRCSASDLRGGDLAPQLLAGEEAVVANRTRPRRRPEYHVESKGINWS